MKGYELSRRDDLESLGYTLLYLDKGLWLPWADLKKSGLKGKEIIKKK